MSVIMVPLVIYGYNIPLNSFYMMQYVDWWAESHQNDLECNSMFPFIGWVPSLSTNYGLIHCHLYLSRIHIFLVYAHCYSCSRKSYNSYHLGDRVLHLSGANNHSVISVKSCPYHVTAAGIQPLHIFSSSKVHF